MKKKKKPIHKFIDKVASESKPIKHKKIAVSDIDMPKRRPITKPQITGFVCSDFEVIMDAEDK